jgi:hypothetical protein
MHEDPEKLGKLRDANGLESGNFHCQFRKQRAGVQAGTSRKRSACDGVLQANA